MCDYDEYCYNPEDFLEEYEVKLREIMSKAVNAKIKSQLEELEAAKVENEALLDRNSKLRTMISDAERARKQTLEEALKAKEVEVFQKILGYCVNEPVYIMDSKVTVTKCDKCTKEYVEVKVLGVKTEVKCPHCFYGDIRTFHYYPKATIVKSISLYVTKTDSWDRNMPGVIHEKNVKIWLEKSDYEKRPEDVCKTIEECQANCDQRNAEEAKNKTE